MGLTLFFARNKRTSSFTLSFFERAEIYSPFSEPACLNNSKRSISLLRSALVIRSISWDAFLLRLITLHNLLNNLVAEGISIVRALFSMRGNPSMIFALKSSSLISNGAFLTFDFIEYCSVTTSLKNSRTSLWLGLSLTIAATLFLIFAAPLSDFFFLGNLISLLIPLTPPLI